MTSPYDANATPREMPTTVVAVRLLNLSKPMRTDMVNTATDVNALSIWMNDTDSVRYARLEKMSEAENRAPIGTI